MTFTNERLLVSITAILAALFCSATAVNILPVPNLHVSYWTYFPQFHLAGIDDPIPQRPVENVVGVTYNINWTPREIRRDGTDWIP